MQKAIKAAESHKADSYVARFCVWRARMLVSSSRIEEGRRWLDQAQHVARALTEPDLSREVFIAKADADARSGDFEHAVASLKEALEIAQAAPDTDAELRCLMPLALTYPRMADHGSAMQTLTQVKRSAERQADALTDAHVLRLESHAHERVRPAAAPASA